MSLDPNQITEKHIKIIRSELLVAEPLISVVTAAYNHRSFLNDCLESLLGQQTEFSYEIIVSDDCSTDGSEEFLIDSHKRHPDKLMLCLADRNLWRAGEHFGLTSWFAARHSRGKYIMFVDGDDYLQSMDYLQRAIGFLEDNPGHHVYFGNAVYCAPGDKRNGKRCVKNEPEDKDFTFEELAENFVPPTAGLVMRRPCQNFFDYAWCTTSKIRLIGWCLTALGDGKARFNANVASVYRLHDQGMSTTDMNTANNAHDLISEFGMLYGMLDVQLDLRMHDALAKGLKLNAKRLIESHLRHSVPRMLQEASVSELFAVICRKLRRWMTKRFSNPGAQSSGEKYFFKL